MIHRECVAKRLIQENNQRSGLEFVLDDIKNCVFHPIAFKEASSVFTSVQRHGSRRSKVIYHGPGADLPLG